MNNKHILFIGVGAMFIMSLILIFNCNELDTTAVRPFENSKLGYTLRAANFEDCETAENNLKQKKFVEKNGVRIMCLGDSYTQGHFESADKKQTYRSHLYWKLIETSGFENVNFVGSKCNGSAVGKGFDVHHQGWAGLPIRKSKGDSHDMLTEIVKNKWLQDARPDVILLHIGSNDHMPTRKRAGSEVAKDLEKLLKIIEAYIDGQKNRDIMCFVAKIISGNPQNDIKKLRKDNKIPQYNKAIENLDIINKRKDIFTLVDMGDAGLTHGDYRDGVHLNEKGYKKMANVWYSAIKKHVYVVNFINTEVNTDVRPEIKCRVPYIITSSRKGSIVLPQTPSKCGKVKFKGRDYIEEIDYYEVQGKIKFPGEKILIRSNMTVEVFFNPPWSS